MRTMASPTRASRGLRISRRPPSSSRSSPTSTALAIDAVEVTLKRSMNAARVIGSGASSWNGGGRGARERDGAVVALVEQPADHLEREPRGAELADLLAALDVGLVVVADPAALLGRREQAEALVLADVAHAHPDPLRQLLDRHSDNCNSYLV